MHFGRGAFNDAAEICRRLGRRVLLVTGRSAMQRLGYAQQLAADLKGVGITLLFHFVLRGTPADRLSVLVTLGIGISVLGQLGDLVIPSIKRDVGIKDIGVILPGHGGLMDRFDSLILVPAVVFHYLSLQLGPLAAGEPARIFSGR